VFRREFALEAPRRGLAAVAFIADRFSADVEQPMSGPTLVEGFLLAQQRRLPGTAGTLDHDCGLVLEQRLNQGPAVPLDQALTSNRMGSH
jgi:hypothetical protein